MIITRLVCWLHFYFSLIYFSCLLVCSMYVTLDRIRFFLHQHLLWWIQLDIIDTCEASLKMSLNVKKKMLVPFLLRDKNGTSHPSQCRCWMPHLEIKSHSIASAPLSSTRGQLLRHCLQKIIEPASGGWRGSNLKAIYSCCPSFTPQNCFYIAMTFFCTCGLISSEWTLFYWEWWMKYSIAESGIQGSLLSQYRAQWKYFSSSSWLKYKVDI